MNSEGWLPSVLVADAGSHSGSAAVVVGGVAWWIDGTSLSALRLDAQYHYGVLIDRLVLTCPVDSPREQLRGAAESAGFTAVELLPYPIALAHAAPDLPPDESNRAVVAGAVRWLAASGTRVVVAEPARFGTVPLTFPIPGGVARLVRWLVTPGQRYQPGQSLARVRLPGGALWDLTAALDGTFERALVAAGTDISARDWLALAHPH